MCFMTLIFSFFKFVLRTLFLCFIGFNSSTKCLLKYINIVLIEPVLYKGLLNSKVYE